MIYQKSKYYNKKTEVDGITFDSKHEAHRWVELKYLERIGEIRELERQHTFELLPAQYDEHGKCVERSVKYIADFIYYDKIGNLVVEDAKGMKTDAYKLKKKMMRYFNGIDIKEV